MSPLLADFIQNRVCKPICEKFLTLPKPERRLVLQIIDAKDRIVEETSIDSFISGFELAWRLSAELNQHGKERSVSRCMAKRSGALSMSGKEDSERANSSTVSG